LVQPSRTAAASFAVGELTSILVGVEDRRWPTKGKVAREARNKELQKAMEDKQKERQERSKERKSFL
jgi:hypothetical protein